MGRNEAMIVAGIGCRKGCPAEAIVALVRDAGAVDVLAAPEWKRDEPGLLEAARVLGFPLRFVKEATLGAVQAKCPTRSAVVAQATGLASVAEAAALANGGVLVRARFGSGWATCAVASEAGPSPNPLPRDRASTPSPSGEGRGEGPTHTDLRP